MESNSCDRDAIFATYFTAQQDTDRKFLEVKERNSDQIQCRAGCSSCCRPDLTVGVVEAASIRNALNQNPTKLLEIEKLVRENPHQGNRCGFLTAKGECSIYEFRPIMCRAFGVPLSYTLDDITESRGVCELNFVSVDLLSLSAEDFMPVNLSMKHLSALNEQYQSRSSTHRNRLDLESIMQNKRI